MIVIICGIPKNEEGFYFCPSCDFVSDNIEDFAASMCWDCVYDIAEQSYQHEDEIDNFDKYGVNGYEL